MGIFFNDKPYQVWSKIWQVGNKLVRDAVPVIFIPSALDKTALVTIEELMNLTPTIVDEATAETTYLGYSTGTSTAAATWAIVKVVESGGLTYFYVVQGGMYFNQIWDNRAALTYVLKTV